jgi:hypothetical protein
MYRDQKSKAIINADVAALNKYKLERENQRKVSSLQNELKEVKDTLSKLCKVIENMESK